MDECSFSIGSNKIHCSTVWLFDALFVDKASGKPIVEADFEQPTRELFMWSILLNRVDLAMIFWDEGKDSMAASLTAAQILKVMGQKTDDFELNKEIDSNIKYVWFTIRTLEGTLLNLPNLLPQT